MRSRIGALALALGLTLGLTLHGSEAAAVLTITAQFDPSGTAGVCGIAYDPGLARVWVYGCTGPNLQPYSTAGVASPTIARPGAAADDVDLEIAPEDILMGTTLVPAGSLLYIDGESVTTEIYAVDKTTGAVLATLNTAFGASHVVGGAYHAGRNTFFLVQDRNGGANANRIAEINPKTGAVKNSFSTLPTIDVNYGDLDICNLSGNLLVVSSLSTSIAEFTPTGAPVQQHALPVGVTSLSGIGQDDVSLEAWVSSNAGTVWRIAGLPCSGVGAGPADDADGGGGLAGLSPNPTRGVVSLQYRLAAEAAVMIRVYDVAGRLVRVLDAGTRPAGEHRAVWDGRDERGSSVRGGVYFFRATTPEWQGVRSVVVLER